MPDDPIHARIVQEGDEGRDGNTIKRHGVNKVIKQPNHIPTTSSHGRGPIAVWGQEMSFSVSSNSRTITSSVYEREGGRPYRCLRVTLMVALLLASVLSALPFLPTAGAEMTSHEPITIRSDSEFKPENGVSGGTGSAKDPYIIENMEILPLAYGHGVLVQNTEAHFVLRNLIITHSDRGSYGVHIDGCTNFTVENVTVANFEINIFVDGGFHGVLRDCEVTRGQMVIDGGHQVDVMGCHSIKGRIWIVRASNINVTGHLVEDVDTMSMYHGSTAYGITVSNARNVTIRDCTIRDIEHYGILSSGTWDLAIVNTSVERVGLHSVSVRAYGSRGSGSIKECHIRDAGGTGVNCFGNVSIGLEGNSIENCSGGSVEIEDCALTRFVDNHLDRPLMFRPTRLEQTLAMEFHGNTIGGLPIRLYADRMDEDIGQENGQTVLLNCSACNVSNDHQSTGISSILTLLFCTGVGVSNYTLSGGLEGVASAGCVGNRFEDIRVEDSSIGLRLFHDTGTTVERSDLVNCTDAIQLTEASDPIIEGCHFSECINGVTGPGMIDYFYNHYTMGRGLSVSNCTFDGTELGLNIFSAIDLTLESCTFEGGGSLLFATDLEEARIRSNQVSQCAEFAMRFRGPCREVTVAGNTIRDCVGDGLSFDGGDLWWFDIHGNWIENVSHGVAGSLQHSFEYTRNIITRCRGSGMNIRSLDYNITFNRIADCSGFALLLHGYGYVHHNTFVNNNPDGGKAQAAVTYAWEGVKFDDGSEGNYWSGYTERYGGAANDGRVGLTPYEIEVINPGIRADEHPLVDPIDLVPPEAEAGECWVVDEGTTVTLNGTSSTDDVGIETYAWSFVYDDHPTTLYGEEPQFSFYSPGTYEITLNATDGVGRWDEDTVNVTVHDVTPPVPMIPSDMTVDQNVEVAFDASSSRDNTGIVVWNWSLDYAGESHFFDGPTFVFTFEEMGVYLVRITLVDASGNSATALTNVTVLDATYPSADAGEDIFVQEGDAITFDGANSTDNVEVVNWTWSFHYISDEVTLYGVHPGYSFDRAGSFEVTLTVKDARGNAASDTVEVHVEPGNVEDGPSDREEWMIPAVVAILVIVILVIVVILSLEIKRRGRLKQVP